jgi:hypothetical protein
MRMGDTFIVVNPWNTREIMPARSFMLSSGQSEEIVIDD